MQVVVEFTEATVTILVILDGKVDAAALQSIHHRLIRGFVHFNHRCVLHHSNRIGHRIDHTIKVLVDILLVDAIQAALHDGCINIRELLGGGTIEHHFGFWAGKITGGFFWIGKLETYRNQFLSNSAEIYYKVGVWT